MYQFRPKDAFPLEEAEWWRAWWAYDYSWNGLATKPFQGWVVDPDGKLIQGWHKPDCRNANLQDFWAGTSLIPELDDHGQVVRHWTAAHLPLVFENGQPAKLAWTEADWASNEDNLASRLQPLLRDDAWIRLDGLIVRGLHDVPAQEISYARTAFTRRINETIQARKASFYSCIFLEGLDLEESSLAHVNFEWSLFKTDVGLNKAIITDELRFHHCRFIADARLFYTKAESLEIWSSDIEGEWNMEHIASNVVHFFNARFTNLNGRFLTVNHLRFESVEASGNIDLTSSRLATMRAAGIVIGEALSMAGAEVGEIDLSNAAIGGAAEFRSLKCEGTAVFSGMHCSARVTFERACLGTLADFQGAVFEKAATFEGAEWPQGNRAGGAFRDVVFHRLADFRGKTPPSPAAFDGCTFRAEARFNRLAFTKDQLFRLSLPTANKDAEAELESLENGCRALKLAAEAARDRLTEQRFHRYELICRRRNHTTPRSERFFSALYGIAGDYGGSLTRPVVNLVLLWLAMALVFAVWGGVLAPEPIGLPDILTQGLETSARNIFRPFGVWVRDTTPDCSNAAGEIEHILTECGGRGGRLAFRLVSTLEAVAAGILIFLIILATKRRFQIA